MQFLKKWGADVCAVLLFLLISTLYFLQPISQGLTLGGHDSVAAVGQGREQQAFYAQTGERSRWTNTLFGGMPTWQTAPAYDSTKTLQVVQKVYQLGTTGAVCYVFLFLLGFYVLLRAFNFRPWLAALGAVLWAFSSYFFIIIAAGHIWKVMALTFIPPTIAGLVLCYRGKLLWGGAVTALFTALQVLANHVQMSYYFLFLMVFIAIAYGVEAVREGKLGAWAKATAVGLLAGTIGLAANTSNLYHTYEYSKQSMRGPAELTPRPTEAAQATDGGLERDYITQWSYGIGETMTLLVPDFCGGGSGIITEQEGLDELPGYDETLMYASQAQQAIARSGSDAVPPGVNQYWGDQPFTVGPVYVGALVCLLFFFGLGFVRGPLKWALAAGTVLSLLFAWGHNDAWFTNWCIDHLPMYNKFRTPSSALVVAEFTMPLLAVLALAEIMRRPHDVFGTRRGQIASACSLALSAGVCLVLWLSPSAAGDCISEADQQTLAALAPMLGEGGASAYRAAISELHHAVLSASALRSLIFILLGAAAIYLYIYKRKEESTMGGLALCAALAVLCLVDLWTVDRRYLNTDSFTDPVAMMSPEPTAADRVVLQDKSDYRVLNMAEGNPFNETSNHTAYFHQNVGGYNAAKLHRIQDLIDRQLNDEIPAFLGAINETEGDMARVPGDSLAPVLNMLNAKYILFGRNANQVVENTYANGNGWFVRDLRFVKNADEEMAALKGLDTKHAAVADAKFRTMLEGTPLDSGRVSLTKRTANEVHYTLETPRGGLAVLSEIYYPGWTATLDGKPVEVGRVNYILRAVKVPAGKHELRMEYRPASVKTTETIAYAAIAIILLAFAAALLLQFRKKKEKQR